MTEKNKIKLYAAFGLLGIALWFFGKIESVKSVGLGMLAYVLIYFIVVGLQKLKRKKTE
ncbi:MAG TPA: hypothetical protein VHP12_07490 [Chitinophagaceae bacterium]|nr:hypothetical protein [Chitinophagaceae bacterium]